MHENEQHTRRFRERLLIEFVRMLAQSAEISSQDDLAWPQLRRKINKLASHTQTRRGSSDCLLTPMILWPKWRACVGAGKKPTTEKRQMFVEPKSCRSRTQWKEQHNTSLFARKKGEKRLGEEEAGPDRTNHTRSHNGEKGKKISRFGVPDRRKKNLKLYFGGRKSMDAKAVAMSLADLRWR